MLFIYKKFLLKLEELCDVNESVCKVDRGVSESSIESVDKLLLLVVGNVYKNWFCVVNKYLASSLSWFHLFICLR